MKKLLVVSACLSMSFASTAFANGAGEADPGLEGTTNAFGSPGFGVAAERSGKGTLGLAANVFGNKGKGNGADPDGLGLEPDHDPQSFGGEPDTSR